MQHATIDAAGFLTGLYDDAINEVPAGAIALTPVQYTQWLAGQQTLIWENGALVAAPAVAASPAQVIQVAAAAAIAAGCAITSTTNPAVNGTYAIDASSTALINGVASYISINGKFPAGQSTLPWRDAAGTLHMFSTTAEFQSFASAIADWVTKISLYVNGVATALPTGGETIP